MHQQYFLSVMFCKVYVPQIWNKFILTLDSYKLTWLDSQRVLYSVLLGKIYTVKLNTINLKTYKYLNNTDSLTFWYKPLFAEW